MWYEEMVRRGWSDKYFAERYMAVLDSKKIYGALKFNDFIDAERLYTRAEAMKMANEIIEQRKAAVAKFKFDENELAEEGLMDLRIVYARMRDEYKRKIGATVEQRVKRAEKFIKAAPEEIKLEILSICHAAGLIGDDPHWRQILHFFAADILPQVEKIMRRV